MEGNCNNCKYNSISTFKSQFEQFVGVEAVPQHVFKIVEKCVKEHEDEPITRRLIYQILLDQGLSKYLLDVNTIFEQMLLIK